MAYKLDQDAKTVGKWFASQFASIIKGSTWEESVSIWKLSNVLGWYMSNYLALKTQLMVGFERKINMLYKYEWYMTAPTKTLLNGETKIDLAEVKKTTPSLRHFALVLTSGFTKWDCTNLEKKTKALNTDVTNAKDFKETHGSHTMTVLLGNSNETMAVGDKNITTTAGSVGLTAPLGAVRLNGGGASSLVLNSVNVVLSGPVINIG